jgi:hypothetical protein
MTASRDNNFAHLGLFQEAYKEAAAYSDADPDGEFSEEIESRNLFKHDNRFMKLAALKKRFCPVLPDQQLILVIERFVFTSLLLLRQCYKSETDGIRSA